MDTSPLDFYAQYVYVLTVSMERTDVSFRHYTEQCFRTPFTTESESSG